jgi:hypothetical protein
MPINRALVGTLTAALFVSSAGCAALQQMHDDAVKANAAHKADADYDDAHPRNNAEPAKLAKVKTLAIASVYAPEEGGVSFGQEWATYSNQALLDRTESDVVAQLTKMGFDVQPLDKTKSAFAAGWADMELAVLLKRPSMAGRTKEDVLAERKKNQEMMDQWNAAMAQHHIAPQQHIQSRQGDPSAVYRGKDQISPPIDASSANTFLFTDDRSSGSNCGHSCWDFYPHRFVDPDKKGMWSAVLLDTVAVLAKRLGVDAMVLVAEETWPKHGDESSTLFHSGEAPKVNAHMVVGIVDTDGALVFQAIADAVSQDPFGTINGTNFHYEETNLNNSLIEAGNQCLATTMAALKSAAGK